MALVFQMDPSMNVRRKRVCIGFAGKASMKYSLRDEGNTNMAKTQQRI